MVQKIFGQGMKGPGLAPAHVGDFVGEAGPFLEVEKPFRVVHVFNRPLEDPVGQFFVCITHPREKDDGLGRGVDVNGPDPVMVVFWCPVREEEVVGVKPGTLIIGFPVFTCISFVQEIADALEVEAGMERIDPTLDAGVGIEPGAVGSLAVHAVGNACQRGVFEGFILYEPVKPDKERGTEEVGVVDDGLVQRCVAEAERAVLFGAMEVVEDEVLDGERKFESSFVAGEEIRVEQGVADEGGVDDGRRVLGDEKGPRLPVEVIAPAVARVAMAFQFFQQVQQVINGAEVGGIAIRLIELRVSPEEQADSLRVMALADAEERAEVERKLLQRLDEGDARPFPANRQCREYGAVQGVVGVVAFEALSLEAAFQLFQLWLNIHWEMSGNGDVRFSRSSAFEAIQGPQRCFG